MSYDYTDAAYDDLIKDAERDDRVGEHEFLVTGVLHDFWPSGDPRVKIRGLLLTANSAKADLTISPPPSPEEVKADMANWDSRKKRAIAGVITIYRSLATHYQTTPERITEGQTFRVRTVKTKVGPDGKGGFIRIVVFLPKTAPTTAQEEVPF